MAEQDLTVAHRDDVVMKTPCRSPPDAGGRRSLAGIDLRRATGLASGFAAPDSDAAPPRSPAAAIDKELDAGSAISPPRRLVRRPSSPNRPRRAAPGG